MGFFTGTVNVKLKKGCFVPDFLHISWRKGSKAFISAKTREQGSSVNVDFMIYTGSPEWRATEEQDTVRLKLVEVGLENSEGLMEVRIRFVNVFYVAAGRDLIIDITAKAVRHDDTGVLQGCGEKTRGGTSEWSALGKLVRTWRITDNG
jgi:hypothetical protein